MSDKFKTLVERVLPAKELAKAGAKAKKLAHAHRVDRLKTGKAAPVGSPQKD